MTGYYKSVKMSGPQSARGTRIETLDGSAKGIVVDAPTSTFWKILYDDGDIGYVHPNDVRVL